MIRYPFLVVLVAYSIYSIWAMFDAFGWRSCVHAALCTLGTAVFAALSMRRRD